MSQLKPVSLAARDLLVDLAKAEHLQLISNAMTALLQERPEVWLPNPVPLDRVEKVVVPLDRVGTEQGFSGSRVFVAYFADRDCEVDPSSPFILKIGRFDKLTEEYGNAAAWPKVGDDHRFAKPFFIHATRASDHDGTAAAVMAAPFSSGKMFQYPSNWNFEHRDLWQMLKRTDEGSAALVRYLHSTYNVLRRVHCAGRTHYVRSGLNFAEEYKWYIRELDAAFRMIPVALFGSAAKTEAFGREWPNPLLLVDRILKLRTFTGAFGAVHGDLHPRNVVVDTDSLSYVIDFGWASANGHVVRDFALMDINVRAMALSAHLERSSVEEIARYLHPNDRQASSTDPRVTACQDVIRDGIWAKVNEWQVVQNWEVEYLIPLFLIGFGLLKYLETARNQSALQLTILALAERLEGSVQSLERS